ncbi:MAG: hypothetical protein V3S73_09120 [Gammaproteobacteria bacterium]|nr:hypothetical protein [Gammaproteobacteria bacterium]
MKNNIFVTILALAGALVSSELAADGFQPLARDANTASNEVIESSAELKITPWYLQETNGRVDSEAVGENAQAYQQDQGNLNGFHPWYVG